MDNQIAALADALIRGRRSVFQSQYSGERVDDDQVQRMLENANWAPTHKFTEPWRFIVFTGNGLEQLAREQAELYKTVTERDGSFQENRFRKLRENPLLSSHIIAVAMKRDEKRSVPEIEEIGATFCAVQNILLTAHAYGLGAYLSTGGITHFDEARELFGLGQEDRLLGFIHIGKIKIPSPEGKRRPISEKVNWVK